MGHNLNIILHIGRRSENVVELLRFQQWFSQQKAKKEGGEIIIVKDTLIFPRIVEVCESV